MIYKSRHLILFILCYNVIPIICDIEAFLKGNFEQELFGDGEFHIRDKVNIWNCHFLCHEKVIWRFFSIFQRNNAFTKHQASSTEDLMLLFEAEKEAVKFLNSSKETFNDAKISQTIDQYLNLVDFNVWV